jgi:osmoprotectant transport system permease protein
LVHILLSVPPIVIGLIIATPLGWLANRHSLTRSPLLLITGLLYTIPALPLIIAIPALLSTGILDPINVVITLTIYAVALMVRTVNDGLASVDREVRLAADAMGYSGWGRFWHVELPLAGPVIIAGLRVVSVSTVSLVSIGSIIGVSSLGYLFLNGLQRNIPAEVWSGIVATVFIAVAFDFLLVAIGRVLMPWTRRARPGETRKLQTGAQAVSP